MLWALTLAAQTQIDLRTQARNVDFSAASSTKPMAVGTALPPACAAGAMFFKTNAPAGQNLYACTSANTWTLEGGIAMGSCQYNAASQTLTCTDANNNVYSVVETASSATANQWVDYISSAGAPHTSQPAFAQIAGTVSPAQLPASAMQTNQSNAITGGTQDFSAAAHTLPVKTGLSASLPSACAPGEMYFATDAPAGDNLYACAQANTWSGQGNLSVQTQGVTVGARDAANFIAGVGLLNTITDNGTQINIQSALDTAVVQTQPGEQSGGALLCASRSGSASRYTCSMSPALAAYTPGMVLHWEPDVAAAGGATTLNVDTLGAAPLTLADGVTSPPPSTIQAGQLYVIWYDGSVFRISGGGAAAAGGSQTWGQLLAGGTTWAQLLGGNE